MIPYQRARGFSLIEGIIAIVVMGIAMVTLTSFLFPQVERSAIPQYQARAAAIGHAMLNEILARKFDSRSDPNGDSLIRCGEKLPVIDTFIECTAPELLGAESGEIDPKGSLNTALADDVDDFKGCWGTRSQCKGKVWRGSLSQFVPGDEYANIWAEVDVFYDEGFVGTPHEQVTAHKRITVTIKTTRYGEYVFIAYRSNY